MMGISTLSNYRKELKNVRQCVDCHYTEDKKIDKWTDYA